MDGLIPYCFGTSPQRRDPRHTGRMRTHNKYRSEHRVIVRLAAAVRLADLAARAHYVGSSEHKTYPSFAGRPALRADASKCDPKLTSAEEITQWLKEAILAGSCGSLFEGDFPRYVWLKHDGVVYEGRLVNRELGQYKGYPLAPHEYPKGLT